MEVDFIRAKVERLLKALDQSFVERQAQLRVALLAILSGQHVLLLGPPGTAKSMLARALCECLHDTTFFEYLLSKFTHPDEIFGPVSIPGLKEEDYRRLTDGYLPRAHIAFLDEIFKANSAILNSLLTLINERIFHHGKHRDDVPLIGIVGASNEAPDPEGGLGALYDRFLVRISVPPISDPKRFLRVCLGEIPPFRPVATDKLTLAEVRWLRERASAITAEDSARRALLRIRERLAAEGIDASDRRFRWAVGLVQMSALTSGRDKISPLDLSLLEYCFGDPGGDQGVVRKHVRESLSTLDDHEQYLTPLRQVWSAMQRETPAAHLSEWRAQVFRKLDQFDEICKGAGAVLEQQLARIEAESARTPWCTDVPPELLAGLVSIRTKVQAYQRASTQHRAAVAAHLPAMVLVSRARKAADQRSYYYEEISLPIQAKGSAEVVVLNGQGQPANPHYAYKQAQAQVLTLDDHAAHELVLGQNVDGVLQQIAAQALVGVVQAGPLRGRASYLPDAQRLKTMLEGFQRWARQHTSALLPVAPPLEPADTTTQKKTRLPSSLALPGDWEGDSAEESLE